MAGPTIESAQEAQDVARLIQSGHISGTARDTALQALRDFDAKQQNFSDLSGPKGALESAKGLGDLALTGITGTGASIIGGLEGLVTPLTNAVGLTNDSPADVIRNFEAAHTWQPQSRVGQAAGQAIGAAGAAIQRQLPDTPLAQTAIPAAAQAAATLAGAPELRAPLSALADAVTSRVAPQTAQAVRSVVGKGASPAMDTAVGGPQAAPAPPPAPVSPGAVDAAHAALRADGMTAKQLADLLAQARASGKPVLPVDVGGPNLQGLVRQTVTMPGPGRQITTDALNARATPAASLARIKGDAATMAGNPTQAEVTAAYKAAMGNTTPMQSEPLAQLLESTPAFREAHEGFGPAIADAGESPPPQLFADVLDPNGNVVGSRLSRAPTVRDIDIIKRQIDNQVKASRVPGAVPSNKIEALNALKARVGEMLEHVDQLAPDYAAAREVATRFGRLGKVNKALSTAADSSAFPDLVKPVAGTSTVGAKADSLVKQFGTDPANEFMQRLQLERQMSQARNTVLGGSNTANKLAEAGRNFDPVLDAVDAGHALVHPTTGIPKLAAKVGLRALERRQEAAAIARNTELARGLATPGDAADAFIAALKAREGMK